MARRASCCPSPTPTGRPNDLSVPPRRLFIRRLAWVGIALCLVTVALGLTNRLLGPAGNALEGAAKRIEPGMTLGQVAALLGGPGRMLGGCTEGGKRYCRSEWTGPGAVVYLSFSW